MTAKPDVTAVADREVRFADGSVGWYDTMIAATGYDIVLPFLSSALSPVPGHWLDLYRRVVRPGAPERYFVGFFNVSGGNIRMMDDQAEWVAELVTSRAILPSDAAMAADLERERADIRRRYPDSPRYGLELDPAEYRAQLRQARLPA